MKKNVLAVIFSLIASIYGFSQNEFMIHGRIQTFENSIEGATVRVLENYITTQKIVLDNSGEYTIFLPYGKNYTILFEKKGFTPMQFDAKMLLPKDVEQCCYRPLSLSFHLFKPDSVHNELFQGTFHTIQYDKKQKGFLYDLDIDYMVQQRIVNAELFKQKVIAAKEGNEIKNDSILLEKKYLALINQGTQYYKDKQFYASRKFFMEATKMKPDRMYPKYKLEDIKTELQRFETKAELLGVNIDSLVARELAAVEPKPEVQKPYPPFIPLTDAQVEEIFKNDLKQQIVNSSSNVAEANRTLALMNEFFKEDFKRITSNDYKKETPKVVKKTEPTMVAVAPPKKVKKEEKVVAAVEPKAEQKAEPKVEKKVESKVEQKVAVVEDNDEPDFTAKPIQKPVEQKSNFVPKKVVDYNSYQDSLKQKYTEWRTVEVVQDAHKKTTRVFMNNGKVVEVYAMVEHSWGATYYFLEEYPSGAQNIGYNAFMTRTKLYENQTPAQDSTIKK